ncbi:HNH endonuclease [Streptomyces sp. S07_1.15]|uniref:HNH endonuclease n=1 Tax=Streptomyces sp. S07_1.15 TaxID=2873925 RepID=UPI001D1572BC|nr:HNH endonuclease signature motif containing protein [Streptomyces sp. S07_1.15]MCC3653211.1 HNH endonuclease [Streptomyces sp. S07_1.15]
MAATRPKVPSELRRRVLLEAGHRCAIPTCKSTPVEIAHIIPWSKIRKHEFKNLIALCPTCHARFDDRHGPIDQKAMRQYKANLNPLLSLGLANRDGQVAMLAAYQEFRGFFAEWVKAETRYAAVKSRRSSSLKEIADSREDAIHKVARAIGAVADFHTVWGDSEVSDLAGAIFYHIADWSDEIEGTPFPLPRRVSQRNIAEEISEASTELHLAICEQISM